MTMTLRRATVRMVLLEHSLARQLYQVGGDARIGIGEEKL
jgi:hypothetical protein